MISPSYICFYTFGVSSFSLIKLFPLLILKKSQLVCLFVQCLTMLGSKLKYDTKTKIRNIYEEEQLLVLTTKR